MKNFEQNQAESPRSSLQDVLTKEAIWTRLHIESAWGSHTAWPPDYDPDKREAGQCSPSTEFYLIHLERLARYAQDQKERGTRYETITLPKKFAEEELDAIFSDRYPDKHRYLQRMKQDYLAEQYGLFPLESPDNEVLIGAELYFSYGHVYNRDGKRLSNQYGHCWPSIKDVSSEELDVDITFGQLDSTFSPVVVQPSGDKAGQRKIYVPQEQTPIEQRMASTDERFAQISWGPTGISSRDDWDMEDEFFREQRLRDYTQFQERYFPDLKISPLETHYRGPRLTVKPPHARGRLEKVVEKVVCLLR